MEFKAFVVIEIISTILVYLNKITFALRLQWLDTSMHFCIIRHLCNSVEVMNNSKYNVLWFKNICWRLGRGEAQETHCLACVYAWRGYTYCCNNTGVFNRSIIDLLIIYYFLYATFLESPSKDLLWKGPFCISWNFRKIA